MTITKTFCWTCHGFTVADDRPGTFTLPEKCSAPDQCGRTVVPESEAGRDAPPADPAPN